MGELYQLQASLPETSWAHKASFSSCYRLRVLWTALPSYLYLPLDTLNMRYTFTPVTMTNTCKKASNDMFLFCELVHVNRKVS